MVEFDPAAIQAALANNFGAHPILVIGDVMLDRYLWGEVNRISPEAPVPVVRLLRQTENLGGAANVALNLRGLGIPAAIIGVRGPDPDGEILARLGHTVDTRGLVVAPGRPTACKTRVIGAHQQMLRIDIEDPTPLSPEINHLLAERLMTTLRELRPAALVISDYGKGVVTPELCRKAIDAGQGAGIPVVIDPKGRDYTRYRGATLVSPNRAELALATGHPTTDLEGLYRAGEQLRARLSWDYLLVTLGESGMTLLDGTGRLHVPAVAREVFDVSGAGDTVIAVTAAGLAAGLGAHDAIRLANLAAGVVVGKVGTTPISISELNAARAQAQARSQAEKIQILPDLLRRTTQWRARGDRIVFTNGCFDLLHAGHVSYLERARRAGQRLIVGLNSDRSVRALKGATRPVINERDRSRVLAALESVDAVILFDEDTPLNLIRELRPDILAKGADYRLDQVVGGAEVISYGGEVYLVPLEEGHSSTNIVDRIRNSPDKDIADKKSEKS